MFFSIAVGKMIITNLKLLNLGSGSTWPGHIALKIDKNFIRKIINKNPQLKIVLVAGTNGKTTTTKALTHILDANLIQTFTNESGANLENGLASVLIKNSKASGKIDKNALIFEVDENSLPKVLRQVKNPNALILLNLFRDQLDRYGEVNIVADKWKKNVEKLDEKTLVVANSDDPKIAFIASFAKNKAFFTIDDKYKKDKKLSHAVDSTYCPNCNNSLVYSKISYSHIGNYECPNCKFKNPEALTFDFESRLLGDFNLYNLTAAILTAVKTFKTKEKIVINSLKHLMPAFGRQEIFEVNGKKVMLLLVKNPAGFNESIKIAMEENANLLILLNDRIPDGRDISWIWDVDFDVLKDKNTKINVSGDRAYDMGNRLFYSDIKNEVNSNLIEAYKSALLKTPEEKTLVILPTYSAMLEIRKIIAGKKIL